MAMIPFDRSLPAEWEPHSNSGRCKNWPPPENEVLHNLNNKEQELYRKWHNFIEVWPLAYEIVSLQDPIPRYPEYQDLYDRGHSLEKVSIMVEFNKESRRRYPQRDWTYKNPNSLKDRCGNDFKNLKIIICKLWNKNFGFLDVEEPKVGEGGEEVGEGEEGEEGEEGGEEGQEGESEEREA